jgi:hypothetical protein
MTLMLWTVRVAVLVGSATFIAAPSAVQADTSPADGAPSQVTTIYAEATPPEPPASGQVLTVNVPSAPKTTSQTPKPKPKPKAVVTPPVNPVKAPPPPPAAPSHTYTPSRSSATRTAVTTHVAVKKAKPRTHGGMGRRVAVPPGVRGGASVIAVVPRSKPPASPPAVPAVAPAVAVSGGSHARRIPDWMLAALGIVVLAEIVLLSRFAWRRYTAARIRRRARTIA